MDFIARNSGQSQSNSAAEVIQSDVNAMAAEKNEPVVPSTEEVVPDVAAAEPEPEQESEPEQEPESEPEPEQEGSEDDLELKGTAAENFKNLRTTVKDLKEETKRKDKLLTELTKELESYSKGEKIPEELERREARISELEHYEKVLNLKKSRYYQENFIEPLNGIKSNLERIAKEYNIEPDRLKQAANLPSEAELNRFLSNNFDVVGAAEVKSIVRDYKALQSKAAAAEKEPVQALNKMIEDANIARAAEQAKRLEVMQDTTRDAWREALNHIKDEGKVRELIYKEGDTEHNEKIFTPIVQAAAGEYGKLVKELARNGLESLPKELAYALSRLCQLAHASAVAIDSRERAVSMAEQLENNTKRTQRYIRPSVSGGMDSSAGRNGAGAGGGPNSPEEAAEALLKSVRGR
jgi:hypothetical protein